MAAIFFCPMLVMSAQSLSTLKDGQWNVLKLTWDGPETGNALGCPIGNGQIGARVKNGVDSETLALNDKWFCAGGPGLDPENPQRKAALEETRRLLASGDIPGAERAARGMYGRDDVGSLLPLGRLTLTFDKPESAAGFSRILDLDRAVYTVKYVVGEVTYTRETFASFPDDVIVVRVGSSAKGKIGFTAKLSYPTQMEGHGASLRNETGNVLVMKGKAPANGGWDEKKGMTFEARVKIIADGGTVMAGENAITVTNADSAILIFANATSYNGFDKEPGTQGVDPEPLVQSHTDAIELLPALPTTWTSGKVSGLRARGDYELSLEWSGGQLTKCQIDSHSGLTPVVRYLGQIVDLKSDPRITFNQVAKSGGR
jgi:alpha-L-fucosidase 2